LAAEIYILCSKNEKYYVVKGQHILTVGGSKKEYFEHHNMDSLTSQI
jgi:hypothetical protein